MTDTDKFRLPSTLYRAEQVRAMDHHAIYQLRIPGLTLMERAGAAAFAVLRQIWPAARTVSVMCGSGNNGGDGYVLGRLAVEAGFDVRVYPAAAEDRLHGEALQACQAYRAAGGPVLDFIPANFEGADVLVDGLLGTGLDREVSGFYADIIDAMNRFGGGVLALDIPSGLHADTGHPLGCAVKADVTVSFMALKQGLFTGSGPEYCGRIAFDDLGTPPQVQLTQTPSASLLPRWDRGLPPRSRSAHKGHFGHVLVIGGAEGYSGAARMAAEAAARVGAGLVSVATRPEHAALLNLTRPELMCRGVSAADEIAPLLERASVVAVGPGLGRSDWARALFDAALRCGKPLVVDADGLNLLAERPLRRDGWVLTPHPGEAARMLQGSSTDVQRDRFAAISALHARYGGSIVLKGCGSMVLGESGRTMICTQGNPGMASGGMGDVLTGVIAGLMAQGLSVEEAAAAGVRLHAAAGDQAAGEGGERGLLACDLMDVLRRLVNR